MKPLVKICGLTRAEDAALAVQLGATHVGVVSMASSPRSVDADGARRVFEAVEGLAETVLVMRDLSVAQMVRRARESGTGTVQLGEASDEDVRGVEAEGFRVFRVYRMDEGSSILPALEPEPSERQPALLDVGSGGTGRRFDWSLLDPCAPRWTFIAGGIRPDNVRELLKKKPYGIDLASGVESAPGIKDESKLRAFFSEVS